MTQIHSDWQELRELSDQERSNKVVDSYNVLQKSMEYLVWEYTLSADADVKEHLNLAQQHLDKIKALVMSRSKE